MSDASDTPRAYALGIATVFRCRAAVAEAAPLLIRIAIALECLDALTAEDLPPFVEPYFRNVVALSDRVRGGVNDQVPDFFRGIETLADQLQWFVERNGGGATALIRKLREP